ncbi:hypothetical protein [Caballeronia glebae]|uniref:hypothetical protein n=1 Tax=Caballeronia glebae TaxID=1777143 RepID=UPI00117DE5BD|nr:hypothetical protein [Caballeronia glebae]
MAIRIDAQDAHAGSVVVAVPPNRGPFKATSLEAKFAQIRRAAREAHIGEFDAAPPTPLDAISNRQRKRRCVAGVVDETARRGPYCLIAPVDFESPG